MSFALEEPQAEEPDDNFLLLLGGLLDDKQKEAATKEEITSLMKFLGGFKYWNNLNEECRREVVKYLEYPERTRLGLCSRRDYETVKATPMDVYAVQIYDNVKNHWSFCGGEFENVMVRIHFHPDYDSIMNIHRIFSPLGNDTLIRWKQSKSRNPRKRPKKKSVILESCNYYEEAVKFAEGWMKKCNFELMEIKVEMSKYPFETSIIKSLPKCERIRIGAGDVEAFRWWLHKLPDKLNGIQLFLLQANREVFTLPSDLLDIPQIIQASFAHFSCRADFTDEQFLTSKINWISFDCVSITNEGISQFLRMWTNGSNFDFQRALLRSTRERNLSELTSGLYFRPWDEEFRKEAGVFCQDFAWKCGRGECVQIPNRVDPYESLTLCVSNGIVTIHATGHRKTRDGETWTVYSVPTVPNTLLTT